MSFRGIETMIAATWWRESAESYEPRQHSLRFSRLRSATDLVTIPFPSFPSMLLTRFQYSFPRERKYGNIRHDTIRSNSWPMNDSPRDAYNNRLKKRRTFFSPLATRSFPSINGRTFFLQYYQSSNESRVFYLK